jgi:hypothetical protein
MKALKEMTINERKSEYKTLILKLNPSKGYMQGLNLREYNRINTFHAEFTATQPTKHENYCAHEFENLKT